MNRRDFLRASGALSTLLGLGMPCPPPPVHKDRKFLFVFNSGGWDPTRVFAEPSTSVSTWRPPPSEPRRATSRTSTTPSVPACAASSSSTMPAAPCSTACLVSSVAHEACTRICMTGSTDEGRPDWGAMLASDKADLLLPSLVVAGPSFAGPLGSQ